MSVLSWLAVVVAAMSVIAGSFWLGCWMRMDEPRRVIDNRLHLTPTEAREIIVLLHVVEAARNAQLAGTIARWSEPPLHRAALEREAIMARGYRDRIISYLARVL